MRAYLSCCLILYTFLIDPTTCQRPNLTAEYLESLQPKIRFKAYHGSSMEGAVISDIPVADAELIYSHINRSKPLVLYIHGFEEHPSNESIQTMIGVHLQRGTDNIMLVDWSDLAFGDLTTATKHVSAIATILARTFDNLVLLGLDLETSHVIGYSLGAHIAGVMGRSSDNSIPRITGLDPSWSICYYYFEGINRFSARFVDIIHTDPNGYGVPNPLGIVDFWANPRKSVQPGCPRTVEPGSDEELCSHRRSWRYYAESVLDKHAFPTTHYRSNDGTVLRDGGMNSHVYFGHATSTDARGSFYFETNSASPFSTSRWNEPFQKIIIGRS